MDDFKKNHVKLLGNFYREDSFLKQKNNPNQFIKLVFVEQFGFNHYFNNDIFTWIDILNEIGINGMRVFGFWPFGNGKEEEPYKRLRPFHYNLYQFNDGFFDYLKRWVAYAEEKGIVVLYELFDSCAFWHNYAYHHPFYHLIGQKHPLFRLLEKWRYVRRLTLPIAFSNIYNHALISMQKLYIHKVMQTLRPYSNVIYGIMNEYKGKKDWHFVISHYVKEIAPKILTSGSEADSSSVRDPHVDIWFVHTGSYNFQQGQSNVAADIQKLRQRTGANKILGYSTDGFNERGIFRETPADMRRLAEDAKQAGIQILSFLDQKAYEIIHGGYQGKASKLNVETYKAIVDIFQPTPLI